VARLLLDDDLDTHKAAALTLGPMGPQASDPMDAVARPLPDVDNLYVTAKRAVATAAVDVRPTRSVCSRLTSCGACARTEACGWCAVVAACVPGDRLGVLSKAPVQMGTRASKHIDALARLRRHDRETREAAPSTLGQMGPQASEHMDAVACLLQDVDMESRTAAALTLGQMGPCRST